MPIVGFVGIAFLCLIFWPSALCYFFTQNITLSVLASVLWYSLGIPHIVSEMREYNKSNKEWQEQQKQKKADEDARWEAGKEELRKQQESLNNQP